MSLSDYFPGKTPGTYSFDLTTDNDVVLFSDNRLFFASILADLKVTTAASDFIYFAGWWSDVDIPLGDPKASPPAPTFRATLTKLARGTAPAPQPVSTQKPPENNPGPEVCCMVWRQKNQIDWSALPAAALSLPVSIFGDPFLAAINTATVKCVNYLRGRNRAILDGDTRLFGSHHQKFVVIKNRAGLVAYAGSSDFNADRLFAVGEGGAVHPPSDKGAPLDDINIRIAGPAAFDLLKTFVDRWSAHSEGKNWKLKGASYAPASKTPGSQGPIGASLTAQVTHTYGAGYPFPAAVRTAADAQLKLVKNATQYIYYEDQYLIGNPDVQQALRTQLEGNQNLYVIGVMAPAVIVGDLPWIAQRRSDFWYTLDSSYYPRVLLFEMLNLAGSDSGPSAYLHNKMTIVDDQAVTVGSVNFSRRSWTHDSEVMVVLGGEGGNVPVESSWNDNIALKVRLLRWARHLGQDPGQITALPDAIARWQSIPRSARVRPWRPSLNLMDPVTYQVYNNFYDVVADPA
jgi:phosphatidylserine/phosphatidylglycerophosphate/cardiolipin synthase-like enzyme